MRMFKIKEEITGKFVGGSGRFDQRLTSRGRTWRYRKWAEALALELNLRLERHAPELRRHYVVVEV